MNSLSHTRMPIGNHSAIRLRTDERHLCEGNRRQDHRKNQRGRERTSAGRTSIRSCDLTIMGKSIQCRENSRLATLLFTFKVKIIFEIL